MPHVCIEIFPGFLNVSTIFFELLTEIRFPFGLHFKIDSISNLFIPKPIICVSMFSMSLCIDLAATFCVSVLYQ